MAFWDGVVDGSSVESQIALIIGGEFPPYGTTAIASPYE
jgi:hypothetical protein